MYLKSTYGKCSSQSMSECEVLIPNFRIVRGILIHIACTSAPCVFYSESDVFLFASRVDTGVYKATKPSDSKVPFTHKTCVQIPSWPAITGAWPRGIVGKPDVSRNWSGVISSCNARNALAGNVSNRTYIGY